jgi:hypothetical protein
MDELFEDAIRHAKMTVSDRHRRTTGEPVNYTAAKKDVNIISISTRDRPDPYAPTAEQSVDEFLKARQKA